MRLLAAGVMALMSIFAIGQPPGPSLSEMHLRAANYVDKIARGRRPADLPVEQVERFKLAVNLKNAKALGLTIPPTLLARADEVVE